MSERAGDVHLVEVPQDNVSDDRYLLIAWLVDAGDEVDAGAVLGEFETSKSVFELVADQTGVFHPLAAEGSQVAVGEPVAVIARERLSAEAVQRILDGYTDTSTAHRATPGEQSGGAPRDDAHPPTALAAPAEAVVPPRGARSSAARFSRAAEELIVAHGIGRDAFAGHGLVRASDVLRLRDEGAATTTSSLPDAAGSPAPIRGSAVVIVGAGGHARMLLDLMTELRCFTVVGLLDDGVDAGQIVLGHRVLGRASPEQFARLHARGLRLAINAVGGVTNRPLRPAIWDRIRRAGFGLPTLVHPAATVDASAQIGEGAQILAGSYVGAGASVGDNCIVNNGAVIAHDCVVDDHAHIAPGAMLAGGVTVGRNSLVGMGASVYLGVTIGKDAIIANGVDVFGDVPDGRTVRRTHQ